MDKITGYRLVIEVDGFHDAKNWIYRCVRAGIVKCSQCQQPAVRVWWNDAAEWYPECPEHHQYGDMWTGSTRWNPSSFSLNVLKDPAKAWLETLPEEDRANLRLHVYDATDYYALMVEDWDTHTEHYFTGSASEWGWRLYATITPLTNGEYVYELHRDYMHEAGGHMHAYGIRGAWATESEALAAAQDEARKRRWIVEGQS